jgi:hypothetical protein
MPAISRQMAFSPCAACNLFLRFSLESRGIDRQR